MSISPADARGRVSYFHSLSTDPQADGKNRVPVMYLGVLGNLLYIKAVRATAAALAQRRGLIMHI